MLTTTFLLHCLLSSSLSALSVKALTAPLKDPFVPRANDPCGPGTPYEGYKEGDQTCGRDLFTRLECKKNNKGSLSLQSLGTCEANQICWPKFEGEDRTFLHAGVEIDLEKNPIQYFNGVNVQATKKVSTICATGKAPEGPETDTCAEEEKRVCDKNKNYVYTCGVSEFRPGEGLKWSSMYPCAACGQSDIGSDFNCADTTWAAVSDAAK